MVFLYNLGIRLYFLLISVVSLFNKKAKFWLIGRKKWDARLEASIKKNERIVWFHCASLGEFEQGRPVIEAFRQKYSDIKILLTFFSPSGYEIRKNYQGADYIFYLPIDTRRNAKRFIEITNPVAVIFVKYEFWYHYLNQLKKRNIPVYIISAIFRPDQVFFKSYGGWYRKFLANFEHLFVQNKNSEDLLKSIGVNNVTVTGDTRFDRVIANYQSAKSIPLLEQFAANSKVLIAGSTWPKDEDIIVEYFKSNQGKIKLILAPHEINISNIDKLIAKIGVKSIRYTKPDGTDPKDAQLLVIDTIGILSSAYRYGTIAYIGGGFGVGIHNTLEAAVFGLPIIFGPNYQKFQEAKDLVEINAAFPINNQPEFNSAINKLVEDQDVFRNASSAASEYVKNSAGATGLVVEKINFLK
ncbi:MAG: 3-deoxy-D-manno-octulosonic acid transferase [Tenuifilaceae bacterium]